MFCIDGPPNLDRILIVNGNALLKGRRESEAQQEEEHLSESAKPRLGDIKTLCVHIQESYEFKVSNSMLSRDRICPRNHLRDLV